MTRQRDSGQSPLEREDVQKLLARWGNLPAPLAAPEATEAREKRGVNTLRAAIGSAKRERQVRSLQLSLGAAAAVLLLSWAGVHHFGPGARGAKQVAAAQDAASRAGVASPQAASGGLSSGGSPSRQLGSPGADSPANAQTAALSHSQRPFLIEGPYEVLRGGVWTSGPAGDALRAGDELRALEEPIELSLDRITSAHVASRSVLALESLEAKRQELRLLGGQADFHVNPRRSAEVVVHAGRARIRVTGTAFSVTVGGGQAAAWSEVVVKLGHVEVTAGTERFVLAAGDSWSSKGSATGVVRRASAAGVPEAKAGRRGGPASTAKEGPSAPDDAATTLSEENRLFRAALSARNAGQHTRCVGLLADLLSRFPSSPLRQETIVAQFRCQRAAGQASAAHRTALRYLADYPSGFARDEARSLVVDAAPH